MTGMRREVKIVKAVTVKRKDEMIVDEMGESTISHVILKYWAYLTSAHDA